MRTTRRRFTMTGAGMLASLSLASSPAFMRHAGAQDQPTISYWRESASGSGKIQWVIDNIIVPFNEQGGVQVEATIQPEIWTATQTALAGGAGPDVVFTPGPTFALELGKTG